MITTADPSLLTLLLNLGIHHLFRKVAGDALRADQMHELLGIHGRIGAALVLIVVWLQRGTGTGQALEWRRKPLTLKQRHFVQPAQSVT